MTLPDAEARALIATALDQNILVEAGAGSGKTTALVGRMVALVREKGVDVDRIAAVTFTRKAAGELRERFQGALELARRESTEDPTTRTRIDRALRSMDRAFIGTIHAFCARLLRERPLEAGLDPAFSELTAQQSKQLATRWWNVWLERLGSDGDPTLADLDAVGIRVDQLQHTFEDLAEYSDVDFPLPPVPRPETAEIQAVRADVEELMDRADEILPKAEPAKGWDDLMVALRTAWFYRRSLDWADDRVFLDALSRLHAKAARLPKTIRLNRWESKGHLDARVIRDALQAWSAEESPATHLARQWLAHRYPIAVGFAWRAAQEFSQFRRRTGQLSFHDLLGLTADLLRGSPRARQDLGARYPHILVDEFQDTDPLQAEVLFLLASPPDPADPRDEADWRAATPRPGALFVVGDPKQSIYRFRRADIGLYQQVRSRFDRAAGGFGEVVGLTANFRSRPPVAALVNDVFAREDRFPALATEQQAGFAPLVPVRTEAHPGEGIYIFSIPDTGAHYSSRPRLERPLEAAALANWIADRVGSGERHPGDFLILTRVKRDIETYARALEERNLPVEVSGAGVGIEEELAELDIVLRALTDPDDPVLTVAALTGLFFGLDLDQLLRFREADVANRFDFRSWPLAEAGALAKQSEAGPVPAGLGTLHRWWRRSQSEAADVVVAELAEELALIPYAAAGALGQIRAGALSFALDAVRGAGLDGDTSLVGALEALEMALGEEEAEAPLEPERTKAIRLMNLHKAKGLEAAVVILANPWAGPRRGVRTVVERPRHGRATGWILLGVPGSRPGQFEELARPFEWSAKSASADAFESAEEVRLLYVAASRAADEILVTVPQGSRREKSPWEPFHDWLNEHATPLELAVDGPDGRAKLEVTATEIARRAQTVLEERRRRGEPRYTFDTVTALVRRADEVAQEDPGLEPEIGEERLGYDLAEADATGPGGFEWGNAVHAALEAAARGLEGEALRAAARTALLENDRAVRDDEPVELDTLLALVDKVRESDLWQRAGRADIRLAEQPFVIDRGDGQFLEGVIDLVFREGDGWVVVDYKTDRGEADARGLTAKYRAQVSRYGESWKALTDSEVSDALILWLGPADPGTGPS